MGSQTLTQQTHASRHPPHIDSAVTEIRPLEGNTQAEIDEKVRDVAQN